MSDQPKQPAPGRGAQIWTSLAMLLVVAIVVGGALWLLRTPAPPVSPTATTATVTPTAAAATTSPPAVTTSAVEPTVAPPAASAGLPYTPGPDETGTNFAWMTKMVVKSGYVYITVDYIIIGEDPEGGWKITNNNPKLRVFPLAKTCPCRYLIEGGASLSAPLKPLAFRTKWSSAPSDAMIRHNPYKVTVKHGVVTRLDNEWLP